MSATLQIRGANGSGKSWAVMSVISRYLPPLFELGRVGCCCGRVWKRSSWTFLPLVPTR